MKAIITNGEKFGTLNDVITLNSEIRKIVIAKLKEGKAIKLVDTEKILMYELQE